MDTKTIAIVILVFLLLVAMTIGSNKIADAEAKARRRREESAKREKELRTQLTSVQQQARLAQQGERDAKAKIPPPRPRWWANTHKNVAFSPVVHCAGLSSRLCFFVMDDGIKRIAFTFPEKEAASVDEHGYVQFGDSHTTQVKFGDEFKIDGDPLIKFSPWDKTAALHAAVTLGLDAIPSTVKPYRGELLVRQLQRGIARVNIFAPINDKSGLYHFSYPMDGAVDAIFAVSSAEKKRAETRKWEAALKAKRTAAGLVKLDGDKAGYVYALSNPEYGDGVWKIGMTTRTIPERVRELNAPAGIPAPFKVEVIIPTKDAETAEKSAHELLRHYRLKKNGKETEFFKLPREQLQGMLRKFAMELHEKECR